MKKFIYLFIFFLTSLNAASSDVYCAREGFLNFDARETKQNRSEAVRPMKEISEEEDRVGEVAARQNFNKSTAGSIDALKQNVNTVLPTLEGWCSKEKASTLIDLILEIKPKTCVEIGAFGGSTVFPMASALKYLENGVVIAIDPWDKIECIKYFDPVEDAEHLKWWGNLNINYIYYSYLNMIKKNKLDDYVITMKATSEDAASEIETIDLLHIDGNHSEVVSTLDVQLYLPKVRSGGFIMFNDSLWKERQDAVDLLLEACDAVKLIDDGNCILFKKR